MVVIRGGDAGSGDSRGVIRDGVIRDTHRGTKSGTPTRLPGLPIRMWVVGIFFRKVGVPDCSADCSAKVGVPDCSAGVPDCSAGVPDCSAGVPDCGKVGVPNCSRTAPELLTASRESGCPELLWKVGVPNCSELLESGCPGLLVRESGCPGLLAD